MRSLIVVDMQNDFVHPEGSLYVDGAENIVSHINELSARLRLYSCTVYTKDWHPLNTNHFDKWPRHCVQDTWGAEFHKSLIVDGYVIHKGNTVDGDGYSGFYTEVAGEKISNGLDEVLNVHATVAPQYSTLDIVGVALDVCVKETALDAVRLGYGVNVLLDATAALSQETFEEATEELFRAGVNLISLGR